MDRQKRDMGLPPDSTRQLARWVAGLRYEDLPAATVSSAKRQILDTLAVAWAGTRAEDIEPLRRFFVRAGGRPEARVWCYDDMLPATQVAFMNAMLAAALDFDSLHDRANVHSDGVVVPSVFAVADARGATGAEVVTALVAGSEVMVRLGLATRSHPGWFYSSVHGVFGAAIAASKLLNLDETRTLHAMGIAMSQAAGSQQPLLERSLSKRLQTAYAARSGVEAAMFAEAGVTGPAQPLEGSSGVHALYTALDPDVLLGGLGVEYEFLGMTFKRYPSCMCNHAPIEATLQLAAGHGLRASYVDAITVTISPSMHRLTGAPFAPGQSPQVSAQFSVRYSVASALLRGRFEAADIEPAAVLDPAVLSLVSRVVVEVDEAAGRFGPASVSVRTVSGDEHALRLDSAPGTPSAPLSAADLLTKAKAGFLGAVLPMSAARADALIDAVNAFERCADATALLPRQAHEPGPSSLYLPLEVYPS